MQFQVPQFIEIEDKIFGPLTFKQFLYIAGGAGGGFLLASILPKIIGYPLGVVFIAFGLALAYYKVNERPLIFTLEAMLRYNMGGKKYSWQRLPKKEKTAIEETVKAARKENIPSMSQSKLKDLAWALDIQDKVNQK